MSRKSSRGAPGSRDLESLEKKQHLEQRRKRANKRVREERECAEVAKNRQGYRRNESEVEEESANRERRSRSSVSENK